MSLSMAIIAGYGGCTLVYLGYLVAKDYLGLDTDERKCGNCRMERRCPGPYDLSQ